MNKLPQEFIQNMEGFFNDPGELSDFLTSLSLPRQYGYRINTLKTLHSPLSTLHSKIPWCNTGYYYENQKNAPMGKNPLYQAGLYYIQEPSAMSAAAMLDVQPGEKVLDLCASPGGKSTQIAAALGGEGLLVSNDANMGRIPQLLRNIEMAGIVNSIVLCETPERIAARLQGFFDKVLVDAPCSGEGMFRKDPSAIAAWDVAKPARLAVIQKNILHFAAKTVRAGGFLVYSTCTFNRTENEDIIDDFLLNNGHFKLIKQERIWPHKHRGEGHFVTLLHNVGADAIRPHSVQQLT
ncbi:MAG: RsmB/NOP family class I SAM-dependent RNA methyltransferase, partial [Defluviitaleaceae bacterium]|nr:RsmB/NOP family class I SAM-dependent RNA methyltransferase [Defluviitaleaceae bacterium]